MKSRPEFMSQFMLVKVGGKEGGGSGIDLLEEDRARSFLHGRLIRLKRKGVGEYKTEKGGNQSPHHYNLCFQIPSNDPIAPIHN